MSGEAGLAATLLDPAAPCPPGLSAWNGSDPAARWAVHRNNVAAALVDAVGATFPVVAELVGDDFFRAMTLHYVRERPPRSPVLLRYGDDYADFVAGFEPARGVAVLADVARIEWAIARVRHAADADPLTPAALQALLQDRAAVGRSADDLRLGWHPAAAVVDGASAAVSVWIAHQRAHGAERDAALGAVDAATPESALVVRDGDAVRVLPLAAADAAFAGALERGETLGAAATRASAAAAARTSAAAAAFDVAAALALLLRVGALAAIDDGRTAAGVDPG